jgi:predicted HD superfamily hydrolase involved in NAD metabolism
MNNRDYPETTISEYCSDTEALEAYLKANLKKSRYDHSLRVQDMAVRLAKRYGADISKASFAGRYHDIAKCFDPETMDGYILKYGLPEGLLGNPALAHSKVGASILAHEFGVTDGDILDAVSYHTTARAGMSLLEELIYVADVVEDGRTYPDLKYYQDLAFDDLDQCALEILEYTIGDIRSKGRALDNDTAEARDYIRKKLSLR